MNPGTQLGSYEILSPLGKGGMGEVWRARDQKLGREVAIKTLPEEFAKDEERLARFEREAKLLASLNHPNIATIHGLEEDNGTRFLVLELVEGDTLAERLKRGAIPVEESLTLALQIAEALEAAHEKGVIHRDLKPANIKVTPEGKIKVLDFGLAKAFAGDGADASVSNSPTLSMTATQQGVILGTAAYMSPEQAKGLPTDKRADVFAFGCVLFEMLTGRRTFDGQLAAEILASVIRAEPDYAALQANLHPEIKKLLRRCLEKEPLKRFRDVGDVRFEIGQVLADPNGVIVQPVAAAHATRSLLPWVAASLLVGAVVAGIAVWSLKPEPAPGPKPVTRFPFVLPEDQTFTRPGRPLVAISPDGTQIVYVADGQLYLRNLDAMEAKPIPGTDEDPSNPFFSPDGEWIGFFSITDQQLKKIAITGGPPVMLCDATFLFGVIWSSDDSIVFGQPQGIMRVSSDGATPELLIETAEGEQVYGPQMLPDGETVLFTLVSGADLDSAEIVVESLKTGARKVLVETGQDGRYVPTGHLVYVIEDVLYATPLDLDRLETGGPIPLLDGMSSVSHTRTTHFAISAEGVLVQVPGLSPPERSLVWVDGQGTIRHIFDEKRIYSRPSVSPDGSRIAVRVLDPATWEDLWIYDIATGSRSPLTDDDKFKDFPIWTPDGDRITFRYGPDIYWKRADGSGQAELLWDSEFPVRPRDWSRDERFLVFEEYHPETGWDIWVLSADDGSAEPFRNTPSQEVHPAFSPDGEWIAFQRAEQGEAPQVWVAPYPGPGFANQVSTGGGGVWPLWSPDGKTLYYRGARGINQEVFSSTIETEPNFRRSEPESLFELSISFRFSNLNPSGDQFVMVQNDDGQQSVRQINIVLNWFEELKEKVPTP